MKVFTTFLHTVLFCYVSSNIFAMSCLNGGDAQAHFQYSGVLTDDAGQSLSGFQTVQMRFDLYSSVDGVQGDYSQIFETVEVKDGIFSIEVGPCLPNLSQSYFVQLAVNNEDLASRTKLVTLPVSINSINSEKLSGLTTRELFSKIDESISLVLVDFAENSIAPAIDSLGQNLLEHQAKITNPHSVTKEQVGLSQVDNVKQLPMSMFQTDLGTTDAFRVPSSKAVAEYVASQISTVNVTGFELKNPDLVSHLSRVDNPHNVTKSQLGLNLVSNYLQLPMSYLETVLTTNSDMKVASSSAVASYVDYRLNNQQSKASDAFTGSEVSNLKNNTLANGTTPWANKQDAIIETTTGDYFRGDKTFQPLNKAAVGLSNVPNTNIAYSVTIPADQFLVSEVANLRANKLKDGSTPWTAKEDILPNGSSSSYLRGDRIFVGIPADQITTTEVDNLKMNYLLDGSSPWTNSEASLGAATAGQVLVGDRSWRQLDPVAVGLGHVKNVNVLDSFVQHDNQFISTSKIQANTSNGLRIENQSGQGMLISSNGFIGIKTMDPKHDLDVMGTAHIQDVFGQTASFESTSMPPLMINTSPGEQGLSFIVAESGNVGVQTTNPMYPLEVKGPININGPILQYGTPIGQSEGSYIFESDRKSYIDTSSELDVPSSSAVAEYVDQVAFYKQAIPADQLTGPEVTALKANTLADGTSPWAGVLSLTGLTINGGSADTSQTNDVDSSFYFDTEYQASGATKWRLRSKNSTDAHRFAILDASNNELMTFNQGGNIGIGKVPVENLDVVGNGVFSNGLNVGFSGAVNGDRISIGDTHLHLDYDTGVIPKLNFDDSGDYIGFQRSTNTYYFKSGGTAKMALDSSANLGIGIAAPSTSLHVKSASHAVATLDSSAANTVANLTLSHNGTIKWSLDSRGSVDGTGVDRLAIYNQGKASEIATFLQTGSMGIGTYAPSTALDVRGDASIEGKLGIGTIAPATTLHVLDDANPQITVGNSSNQGGQLSFGNGNHGIKRNYNGANDIGMFTTAGNIYLSASGSGATDKFVLNGGGYVGIGKSSPGAILDIVSPDHANIFLGSNTSSQVSQIKFQHAGTSRYTIGSRATNDAGKPANRLAIYASGSEIATFLQTGSLGLGVVEAQEKLHVNGVAKVDKVKLPDNSFIGNTVAFSAKLSPSNQSLAAGVSVVNWAVEDFDYGNNYNTGTYTFTTPVAGLYQINAGITVGAVGINKLIKLEIHIDGTLRKESKCSMGIVRDINCNASNLFYIPASKAVQVKVSNGDTVSRDLLFQPHLSSFSGFLVRELP
ncbi:MAG: hypothetical protein KC646_08205 [Candidatus Cloacimonetes bacterium]|nr:hypothetical protein [Candidatus Cloacimonadota bacterium]